MAFARGAGECRAGRRRAMGAAFRIRAARYQGLWCGPARLSTVRSGLTRRPVMIDAPPKVTLPTVILPGGETVPAYGLGTWHMGEDRRRAADETAAVRL